MTSPRNTLYVGMGVNVAVGVLVCVAVGVEVLVDVLEGDVVVVLLAVGVCENAGFVVRVGETVGVLISLGAGLQALRMKTRIARMNLFFIKYNFMPFYRRDANNSNTVSKIVVNVKYFNRTRLKIRI